MLGLLLDISGYNYIIRLSDNYADDVTVNARQLYRHIMIMSAIGVNATAAETFTVHASTVWFGRRRSARCCIIYVLSVRNGCAKRYVIWARLGRWRPDSDDTTQSATRFLSTLHTYDHGTGRCQIKMSPHEKSARGEIITELTCLPLIKISGPRKRFPHYRIALEKSLPGGQFTGKNPSRPGGFLPVNCPPGETSGGGAIL